MRSIERSTGGLEPAAARDHHSSSRASCSIDLQERERVRIGFDLHDGPAQTMSAALLQVRMLQGAEGDDLRRGLDELRVIVATSLEEIYELIENLGSHDGANADLGSRLQSCVGSFRARCDIDVTLEVDGDHGPVSESLEIALFRIVQEALSNVRCHSGAEHVAVGVHFTPDEVVCEITDDGAGFSLKEVGTTRRRREPFGLRGMQERARLLDGECAIDSVPGQGTRVRAKIPVWRA